MVEYYEQTIESLSNLMREENKNTAKYLKNKIEKTQRGLETVSTFCQWIYVAAPEQIQNVLRILNGAEIKEHPDEYDTFAFGSICYEIGEYIDDVEFISVPLSTRDYLQMLSESYDVLTDMMMNNGEYDELLRFTILVLNGAEFYLTKDEYEKIEAEMCNG